MATILEADASRVQFCTHYLTLDEVSVVRNGHITGRRLIHDRLHRPLPDRSIPRDACKSQATERNAGNHE